MKAYKVGLYEKAMPGDLSWRERLQAAKDLGIRVVMIPGYDVYYEPSTVETKRRFLENLKRGAEMAEAAVSYQSDVLEDMELGRGNITSLHLKETLPGKYREIPYGTGHVDFEAAIAKAWEMGIRRYVTEFWYTGNENWKEDLDFAYRMMTEILDKQ